MKSYESQYDFQIDLEKPYIVRLDGRKFSNLNYDKESPYDIEFSNIMMGVCEGLSKSFHPDLVYCQSDEISMVFFQDESEKGIPEPIFSGRVQKIASVFASVASSLFHRHDVGEKFTQNQRLCFDARVFDLPDINEAYNAILWRQQDCFRNCVQKMSQFYFGHKQIQNVKNEKLIENLGDKFISLECRYKYGLFLNKVKDQLEITQMISSLPLESPEAKIRWISQYRLS